MANAHRRAGFLRYAAMQFVVLVAAAMVAYPGGTWWDRDATSYQLAHNFLSDLGATHAFSGRANHPAQILFAVALVTLGGALVPFAWGWRQFAFTLGRARFAGIASALAGTASGAAFAGVAVTPIDLVLRLHLDFVIAAFGLLLVYVACLTFVMWRNRSGNVALALAYLALVSAYFAIVLIGPRLETERGFEMQVVAQKIVACGSMLYIAYITSAVRRR
ncbi:MAG TPA: hypothetical protein VMJ10_29240 [Kofleriaceae bacterium]|nr:hypothetical protein [Kofleriaceae bacterium]